MTKRHEWTIERSVSELLRATEAKIDHHERRLAVWQKNESQVVEDVKCDGLKIDQPLERGSTNVARGMQMVIDARYQQKLSDCHRKIEEHQNKLKDFAAWKAFFNAEAPEHKFVLDQADYLFFFGA